MCGVYSKEGTSKNIQANILVTWLRLNVTEVGETLLHNKLIHINEMDIKIRWFSPSSGVLWCVALKLLCSGLGSYEY